MMPTRITFFASLAVAVLLSGCFNRDQRPIYAGSEEVEPIEAPAGLDRPLTSTVYDVPGYSLPELAAEGQQEWPPKVQTSADAEKSRSHIRFGRNGLYLAVEDEPGSVWRRLGFTLDRGDMQLRRASEGDRRYVFRFSHDPIEPEKTGFSRLFFWQQPEAIDYSGDYVARVEPADRGDETRVELFDEDGSIVEMDRAEFVLARLRERLG